MKTPAFSKLLPSICIGLFLAVSSAVGESIARIWNEQNLAAIRIDFPHPPAHARNLFHTSAAMWDAWAAYDPTSVGYFHREAAIAADVKAAREEAISYAAYGILKKRYASSVNAGISLEAFKSQMLTLGYDPDNLTTDGDSPAAVGNRVAATILGFASSDNSNEEIGYDDPSYTPVNDPLILDFPGTQMNDPNRWQPLAFESRVTQNGLQAELTQTFLGSHWGAVRPFGMVLGEGESIYFDPGPPPQLGGADDAAFKAGNVSVIDFSSRLDPSSSDMINISPGVRGNNPLGENSGSGHEENPVTKSTYEDNIVPHGDYGRVVAEFWADGPDSETPPGHWNSIANSVTDHPDFERRFMGTGPVLDPLEWDVKLYFALNAATHDAAIAVWGSKRVYDYVRPISSIRHMAGKGQSSDPEQASFDPAGLPLEPGLIEVVTEASSASGQKHEGLAPGTIAIFTWGGEPDDPESQFTGAKWIDAEDWLPYQRDTFVTPAFAGYVSGHSAFSRAAAEVLSSITGSPYFPGGMATFTAAKNEFLRFEIGPSVEVQLQWATYFDAADEAGISRIYGGIHVPVDDGPGRVVGSKSGIAAWHLATQYFDGSVSMLPDWRTDTDGDGIPNVDDPDDDNDGTPDVDDAFPLDPNDSADTDGDGVADSKDIYPNDAERATISDHIEFMLSYIADDQMILDGDFRLANQRQELLTNLEALQDQLIAAAEADSQEDPEQAASIYAEAREGLADELIKKTDGLQQVCASKKNDWVITQKAQDKIYPDLIIINDYLDSKLQ